MAVRPDINDMQATAIKYKIYLLLFAQKTIKIIVITIILLIICLMFECSSNAEIKSRA